MAGKIRSIIFGDLVDGGKFSKYDTVEIFSVHNDRDRIKGFLIYCHKGLFTKRYPVYRRADVLSYKNEPHNKHDTKITTCRMVLTEKYKKWENRWTIID